MHPIQLVTCPLQRLPQECVGALRGGGGGGSKEYAREYI